MKTNLPENITSVQEATNFLTELYNNRESYHPEDDAFDIIWSIEQTPTDDEKTQLNHLMKQIYELPEVPETFDPCGCLMDLHYKEHPEDHDQPDEEWGEVIVGYTRKEALQDGEQVLADPQLCREAGFIIPVYLTRVVYERYVKVPKGMEGYQDEEARLLDILHLLHHEIKQGKREQTKIEFNVVVEIPQSSGTLDNEELWESDTQRLVTLLSEIGATDFDNPAPCICIMTPIEE